MREHKNLTALIERFFLKVGMFLSPSEFRMEYEDQLVHDIEANEHASISHAVGIFVDVLRTAFVLRLESVTRDVIGGARALLRAPLSSSSAVLSIAIALGVNVAVASVLYSIILRPLPYKDPEHRWALRVLASSGSCWSKLA